MATLTATNYTEFVAAIGAAVSGDIVFIPGDSLIDMTGHAAVTIPAGVEIRGERGNYKVGGGTWLGGLIYSNTNNANLLKTGGAGTKIRLLRIQGNMPNTTNAGQSGFVAGIIVTHNGCNIEWCDISGFAYAGVQVNYTNTSWRTFITRCVGHHCQHNGLGYVVTVNHGYPIVSYCRFYNYRHCVAGSGDINTAMEVFGCLVDTPNPATNSHSFDMHSVDGDDRANPGRTSYLLNYHDNVFKVRSPSDGEAHITVRGIPVAGPASAPGMIYIQNNKFAASSLTTALDLFGGGESNAGNAYTTVGGNTLSYTGPYVDPADTALYWGAPPVDDVVTAIMTAPADGSIFVGPASITLSATASTTVGSITGVEFFYGSIKIGDGVLSAGVWSYNWTGVLEGTYLVTAKATDTAAEIGVSTAITIEVDPEVTPPTVNLDWIFTRHSYINDKLSNFVKRAPWLFRGDNS